MRGTSMFPMAPPTHVPEEDTVDEPKRIMIGLVAFAGTGKTTFAKEWVKKHPAYAHGSIAVLLKDAAKALAPGLQGEDLNDQGVKASPLGKTTVRGLLDGLGSLVDTSLGSEWLMSQWLATRDMNQAYILDDIRTEGQAREFRKAGGVLVFLKPRLLQPEPDRSVPNEWVRRVVKSGLPEVTLSVDRLPLAIEGLETILKAHRWASAAKHEVMSNPAIVESPYK